MVDERNALVAERDALIALLRVVEWNGGDGAHFKCVSCGRHKVQWHETDCALDALLRGRK